MHLHITSDQMRRLMELHDIHRNAHSAFANKGASDMVEELVKKAITRIVTSSSEWKQFIAPDAEFLIKDLAFENLEATITVVFSDRPCFDCVARLLEE